MTDEEKQKHRKKYVDRSSGPFWDTLVVYNGVFWESQGLDPIKQFSQPNLVDRSRPL